MSRPEGNLLLEVGRWQLLKDSHTWIVRDTKAEIVRWPSSLPAALKWLYENVIADNRFNDGKAATMAALRDAILTANTAFEDLLTVEKVAELTKIVRGDRL